MNHSTFAALRGSWHNRGQTQGWQSVPNGKVTCLVKTDREGPALLGVPLDEELLAVGSEGQVTFLGAEK